MDKEEIAGLLKFASQTPEEHGGFAMTYELDFGPADAQRVDPERNARIAVEILVMTLELEVGLVEAYVSIQKEMRAARWRYS